MQQCFSQAAIGITAWGNNRVLRSTCELPQDGSVSTWRRQNGGLTYALLAHAKLTPPPLRVNNNATPTLLCMAAAAWVRYDPAEWATAASAAEPNVRPHAVSPPEAKSERMESGEGDQDWGDFSGVSRSDSAPQVFDPGTTEEAENTCTRQAASGGSMDQLPCVPPEPPAQTLLIMCASDTGHVWQWDAPLATLACNQKAPVLPTRPVLGGLLHTLPHPVVTFSVCPLPVGVAASGVSGPPSSASGIGGDAVAVLAAVTASGNIEFVALQRGPIMPLAGIVSVSLSAPRSVLQLLNDSAKQPNPCLHSCASTAEYVCFTEIAASTSWAC